MLTASRSALQGRCGRLTQRAYTNTYLSHFCMVVDTCADSPSVMLPLPSLPRPYLRFFSQCLQLLHAARMAGGATAMRLARTLLQYTGAPQGAILPLRGLTSVPTVPGVLHLPRERLRVPPALGLPLADVPLSPLLSRLDAPALLLLYVALLSERRIMFVAASLGTLTSCVHAAAALVQPFEWQHIFIPTLPAAYLPYCCAPNPYLIGLTPPQFAALNEEYDVGEIVLVALDEGYVAVLNGGAPLTDLEATPTQGGSGTTPPGTPNSGAGGYSSGGGGGGGPGGSSPNEAGFSSYAGPKLTAERAMQRVVASLGGSGRDFSGSFAACVSGDSVGESPLDPAVVGAGGGDGELSPWYSFARSHAYDDDAVVSRTARRAHMLRRMAARQVLRDAVAKLYS